MFKMIYYHHHFNNRSHWVSNGFLPSLSALRTKVAEILCLLFNSMLPLLTFSSWGSQILSLPSSNVGRLDFWPDTTEDILTCCIEIFLSWEKERVMTSLSTVNCPNNSTTSQEIKEHQTQRKGMSGTAYLLRVSDGCSRSGRGAMWRESMSFQSLNSALEPCTGLALDMDALINEQKKWRKTWEV